MAIEDDVKLDEEVEENDFAAETETDDERVVLPEPVPCAVFEDECVVLTEPVP